MTISDIVNLGSAGAVILTVVLFLKYLQICHKVDKEERETERGQFIKLIGNDLHQVGVDLSKVAGSLDKVNDALGENTEILRKINGKGG